MKFRFFLLCLTLSWLFSHAQIDRKSVVTGTVQCGVSAVSVRTLTARTYKYPYAIYECVNDSLSDLLLVSARQQDETSDNVFLNRGVFSTISLAGDSVKWLTGSQLHQLTLAGTELYVSSDSRSAKYSRQFGFEQKRFNAPLLHAFPRQNTLFVYSGNGTSDLECYTNTTGEKRWTTKISPAENWLDAKMINDSVLLVSASGLHALDVSRGELWQQQLSTSDLHNGTLVYSRAKHETIKNLSSVRQTGDDAALVTGLASNILFKKGILYYACKEKLLALTTEGKILYELDLRSYQASKMLLSMTDTALVLVNFGLAMHGENFATGPRA